MSKSAGKSRRSGIASMLSASLDLVRDGHLELRGDMPQRRTTGLALRQGIPAQHQCEHVLQTEVLQQRLEMPMLGQARQPLVHFGHKVHC